MSNKNILLLILGGFGLYWLYCRYNTKTTVINWSSSDDSKKALTKNWIVKSPEQLFNGRADDIDYDAK